MWILDYLDDLDADFRRFYRIDGIGDERFPHDMSAHRFFALAHRVSAYEGVMASRLMEQEHGTSKSTSNTHGSNVTEVASDKAVLMAHPDFADLIE